MWCCPTLHARGSLCSATLGMCAACAWPWLQGPAGCLLKELPTVCQASKEAVAAWVLCAAAEISQVLQTEVLLHG